jgi:Ala-tRNA(Pro) deacylase
MLSGAEAILAHLESLGIQAETHRHVAVFTVEEAEAATGHLPGAHVKNLFLEDRKGGLWLLTCADRQVVKVNGLARRVGAPRFAFAGPDRLRRVLGVEPGSVTPLSLVNDTDRRVSFLLDQKLLDETLLNVHPLVNTATTALTPADLLRFLQSTGHEPRLLDLDATLTA